MNLQIFHYKNNLKIGFEKCKYILKSTFQNITLVSNMSQARSNVEKTLFFQLNIHVCFSLIHITFKFF